MAGRRRSEEEEDLKQAQAQEESQEEKAEFQEQEENQEEEAELGRRPPGRRHPISIAHTKYDVHVHRVHSIPYKMRLTSSRFWGRRPPTRLWGRNPSFHSIRQTIPPPARLWLC